MRAAGVRAGTVKDEEAEGGAGVVGGTDEVVGSGRSERVGGPAGGVVPESFEGFTVPCECRGCADHCGSGACVAVQVLDVRYVGAGAAECGGERVADLVHGET